MEYIAILLFLAIVGGLLWRDTSKKKPVVKKTAVKKPSKPVVADKNNNGITSKAALKKLTKNQLVEFADKKNLKIKKSGSKASVINDIHSQLRK